MTREREIRTFFRLGLPGMTLRAPAPELVKRCACGKRISFNKSRCFDCQQEVLQELGDQIDSQDLLDAMLDRSFPEMRQEMLDSLKPYLKFKPKSLYAEVPAE